MKIKRNSKYDYLFQHNVENNIKNIIIYGKNDNWDIEQKYTLIDKKDHEIWNKLFNKVFSLAYRYGNDMFREGIDLMKSNNNDLSNRMPNLNDLSNIIFNKTGWKIKTVAGFVDEVIFFDLLKEKQFPSSDIIRLSKRFFEKYKNTNVRNELAYTPEPDIFHEIFGHAPFLFNQKYCDLLENIGKIGCDIINNTKFDYELKSHNLKRLQNFVWWTLEFGVLKSNNKLGYEIYGAGILSSYDEIKNVLNCIENNNNLLEYNLNKIVLTRFDYSELQDRYFIINSFEELVNSFYENINSILLEYDE